MTPPSSHISDSGIRDNYLRGNVADFLRGMVQADSEISIVSAYFTIYAYQALKNQLDQIYHLRFLFGEPSFLQSLDPDKTNHKAFQIAEDGIQLSTHLEQRRIARECADWIRAKVEIRSVRQANLLHAKMYHIDNSGVEHAILGSANFTASGLGVAGQNNNIELDLVVDSNRDRCDLKAWFDELWNNQDLVEDVTARVLEYLSQLYQDNAPEFVYYKTLFHIFEQYLSDREKSGLEDVAETITTTEIWHALFEFQKDGVKGAINKILAYNGCILADSVGLGKTYEALAVIKYFELRNERVLVLCPKKLRENWTIYQAQNNSELNPFLRDRFHYTVLCHTDLSREQGRSGDIELSEFNWSNYDLVVIDESHNFRNNTPGVRDEEGIIVRRSRYQRLMEDIIKSGGRTKVLMLSATPVNNNLKDLRNQIYIVTEEDDQAFDGSLGIVSIKETLAQAQRTFTEWAKKSNNHQTKELMDQFDSAFFKLLDALTIARSRRHIVRYYPESLERLGGFPERLTPKSVVPSIDLNGEFMSYDMLNDNISEYRLSIFKPSFYVKDEYKATYDRRIGSQNFRQSDRETFLIGMMKVNFLKRLESSVHSFNITMRRTVDKIDALMVRIRTFQQFQADNPDLDFDDLILQDVEDEDLQPILEAGKLRFNLAHLDLDRWLVDLRRDRDQLHMLELSAREITIERDAKLAELKKLVAEKINHPTTNKLGQSNRKVLIFTAFADTAVYLYNALQAWAREQGVHIAMVSGGSAENKTTFGKNDFNHILINFSPYSRNRRRMHTMPQNAEIDILIATDCISEGQNLQDCDTLINYDIHWNPVRVIQRFGRIDRIGSINHAVQLINFWPTSDLEKYLSLKNRVEARMALVDIAATNEDNLLSADDLQELITDDLKYRDKQLLRLQKEVLDLEDFNETVDLTDFTLDIFRDDLNRYLEANRKALEAAPLGLYAVVPVDTRYPVIQPGVIFCLKQPGDATGSEVVNPLQPYYLAYVYADGNIRYSFAHPKQILEVFRSLCAGNKSPLEELCSQFNQSTRNGEDMSQYTTMLEKTVESIERTYRKKVLNSLATDRGFVLPTKAQQATKTTDFELITWLIIC
ncbi:MAG TPA: phospholipase D-like domain-containing protein [Anaerolineaceae bacterium]|nr:phospholipase D-like domain-containing protein [Anaerolineaceae bacterium]